MITLHDGTEVADGTPVKMVDGELHALTQAEIDERNAAAESNRLNRWPEKKRMINQWRDDAMDAGVVYGAHTFDSDAVSRANLAGIVASVSAGIPLPNGFTWRSADNLDVSMDSADLIHLGGAMLAHVNACYARSWELKAAVDAINQSSPTSDAELDAIAW